MKHPRHPLLLLLGEWLVCVLFGLGGIFAVLLLGNSFAPEDPTTGLGSLAFLFYGLFYGYPLGVWVGDSLYNSWRRHQNSFWLPLIGSAVAIPLVKWAFQTNMHLSEEIRWGIAFMASPILAILASGLGRIKRTPVMK